MYIYTHTHTYTGLAQAHHTRGTTFQIYIHLFILVQKCIHLFMYIHTYIHIYIHMIVNSHTDIQRTGTSTSRAIFHTYIHDTFTYIHTYIHTHQHVLTYIYIYTHTHTHTHTTYTCTENGTSASHSWAPPFTYTYIYTYTHISIHTYIHMYIHIHVYINTHTPMHTHTQDWHKRIALMGATFHSLHATCTHICHRRAAITHHLFLRPRALLLAVFAAFARKALRARLRFLLLSRTLSPPSGGVLRKWREVKNLKSQLYRICMK